MNLGRSPGRWNAGDRPPGPLESGVAFREASGGLFELDLELSEALIPVGGVLPEPPAIETPRVKPDENEPTPY